MASAVFGLFLVDITAAGGAFADAAVEIFLLFLFVIVIVALAALAQDFAAVGRGDGCWADNKARHRRWRDVAA